MKFVLAVCVVLALAITAHGQQGDTGPVAAASCEPQPNPIGQRLQQLRQRAYELEQAGNLDQAAAVHRQADQERLALLGRLDALETEAEQVRQALGAGTQVLVHVQVVELPITKLRALGFDFQKFSGRSALPFPMPANAQPPDNTPAFSVIGDDGAGIFAALRQDKLLKVLAEPTLVTLSGRTAVLEVGDVPVPKKQPDGSVTIEHQSATMMRVTPEVLGNRVRLAVHCRVAQLDPAHTVHAGQETVPGVRTLEFDTSRVEMNSSETVVLGGTTEARVESQQRGVPYVSEIPYVGAVFRSVEETRSEVATYVLVRAEIVQRAAASPTVNVKPGAAVPSPRPPHPVGSSDGVPSATARRSLDGDVRR